MTAIDDRTDIPAALAEIGDMLGRLEQKTDALAAKLDGLEREFAPLARRYSRLANAAAGLPGAGWRRGVRGNSEPGAAEDGGR